MAQNRIFSITIRSYSRDQNGFNPLENSANFARWQKKGGIKSSEYGKITRSSIRRLNALANSGQYDITANINKHFMIVQIQDQNF